MGTNLDINLGCNNDLGAMALCNLFRSLPSGLQNLSLELEQNDENCLSELMSRLSFLPFLNRLNLVFRPDWMQGKKAYGVGLTNHQHLHCSIVVGGSIATSGCVVKALLQGVPQQFREQVWVECSTDSET